MMRQPFLSLFVLSLLVASGATQCRGHNPGITKPTLEALVGNSSQITVVRVKSFDRADNKPTGQLVHLNLEVREHVKRPWIMPDADDLPQGKALSESVLKFTESQVPAVRFYGQGDWGTDFTSPIGGVEKLVNDWHTRQTELLLFQDFATPNVTIHMLVDPERDRVVLNDWSLLPDAAAIRDRIPALIDRYRGVEKLRLVFLDESHFAPVVPTMTGGKPVDGAALNARCLCMPADSDYEKLLLAQIKYPEYRQNDGQPVMMSRVEWLRFTKDIYSFPSVTNAAILRELVDDPKTGSDQRALLKAILLAWEPRPE